MAGGGTRGIRITSPNSGAEQQAEPVPQQPRVASTKAIPMPTGPAVAPTVSLTVNFGSGSAELAPDAKHTLDALGQALASKDLAGYRFRIEGHTDTVGSRESNRVLSERRAAAVVSYIAEKFGVDPSRLEAVGMGQEGLLVPTPPQTPEPRNRRVQVVNIGV
jgi:outer membrane protein OmpA-like peptidoglycan-associated protein